MCNDAHLRLNFLELAPNFDNHYLSDFLRPAHRELFFGNASSCIRASKPSMFLRQSSRFLRSAPSTTILNKRLFAAMSQSGSPAASSESGRPVEQAIRKKLIEKFGDNVTIHNDSHLHKHHKAMADSTSAETHFRLVIVSNEFEGSRQIQRHRMVNQLLKEELAREGGIHALQVKALTPEEEEKKSAQD